MLNLTNYRKLVAKSLDTTIENTSKPQLIEQWIVDGKLQTLFEWPSCDYSVWLDGMWIGRLKQSTFSTYMTLTLKGYDDIKTYKEIDEYYKIEKCAKYLLRRYLKLDEGERFLERKIEYEYVKNLWSE